MIAGISYEGCASRGPDWGLRRGLDVGLHNYVTKELHLFLSVW